MEDVDSKTVLYVEDDPPYVLLLKRALQRSKLEKLPKLWVVTTMEDAVRYLLGQIPYEDRFTNPLPSLLLRDLRLPRKSGIQLVQSVQAQLQFQHLPIVILTGTALDEDIVLAYQQGVNFCLVKPADVDSLISIILVLSVYSIPSPTKATI
ncbi:response regulator [Trichormus azollae]|jgi:CheY-like chemotaxis protein|uniref:Response regulator receiver protein n=1 Tax=Nostoc azollae (strain 0708) TaxID=551115 RepID=D7DYN2_NOSA0|nr:response regulator [Trichormus azollae]ADI62855.1 response regulator receiver protein ['Nostoc azollae' 0708]